MQSTNIVVPFQPPVKPAEISHPCQLYIGKVDFRLSTVMAGGRTWLLQPTNEVGNNIQSRYRSYAVPIPMLAQDRHTMPVRQVLRTFSSRTEIT